MLVEDGDRVATVGAAVVKAVGQADEVAGEAIAADVCGLPDPPRVELVAQHLVQRSSVAGAARVVLTVRADKEEGMVERDAGALVEKVELAQVLVTRQLEAPKALDSLARIGHVGEELG
jgi:hypothetical protein